jgi:hypothetical protein
MKTEKADIIHIVISGQVAGKINGQNIILTGKNAGNLKDGREVKKVKGQWIYEPK